MIEITKAMNVALHVLTTGEQCGQQNELLYQKQSSTRMTALNLAIQY